MVWQKIRRENTIAVTKFLKVKLSHTKQLKFVYFLLGITKIISIYIYVCILFLSVVKLCVNDSYRSKQLRNFVKTRISFFELTSALFIFIYCRKKNLEFSFCEKYFYKKFDICLVISLPSQQTQQQKSISAT